VPNHKSRKKNVKSAETARMANRSVRTTIRTSLKVVRSAQSKEEMLKEVPRLFSLLDKASASGRAGYNPNRVANYKSKVARLLNQWDNATPEKQ